VIRSFDRSRHLIVEPLCITWATWAASEMHPLIDGAFVQVVSDGRECRAGGLAVRLWPTRTSRRVRLVTFARFGHPVWSPYRSRLTRRGRNCRRPLKPGQGGADMGTAGTTANPDQEPQR
jgi:hypothetical protein